MSYVKIGVAGPVGSGKTALIEALSRKMAGDSQEFSYHVKESADLEVLSQSFEKIHKMDEGSAT